jgi:hypothetical protein
MDGLMRYVMRNKLLCANDPDTLIMWEKNNLIAEHYYTNCMVPGVPSEVDN